MKVIFSIKALNADKYDMTKKLEELFDLESQSEPVAPPPLFMKKSIVLKINIKQCKR